MRDEAGFEIPTRHERPLMSPITNVMCWTMDLVGEGPGNEEWWEKDGPYPAVAMLTVVSADSIPGELKTRRGNVVMEPQFDIEPDAVTKTMDWAPTWFLVLDDNWVDRRDSLWISSRFLAFSSASAEDICQRRNARLRAEREVLAKGKDQ